MKRSLLHERLGRAWFLTGANDRQATLSSLAELHRSTPRPWLRSMRAAWSIRWQCAARSIALASYRLCAPALRALRQLQDRGGIRCGHHDRGPVLRQKEVRVNGRVGPRTEVDVGAHDPLAIANAALGERDRQAAVADVVGRANQSSPGRRRAPFNEGPLSGHIARGRAAAHHVVDLRQILAAA